MRENRPSSLMSGEWKRSLGATAPLLDSTLVSVRSEKPKTKSDPLARRPLGSPAPGIPAAESTNNVPLDATNRTFERFWPSVISNSRPGLPPTVTGRRGPSVAFFVAANWRMPSSSVSGFTLAEFSVIWTE
jgi:hypothetical protein